ncbi:beta-1,4 N-acetylgalactosaminyltransferase 2-like [Trichomycterus rosablanca]|uniref:beta-1,4 N-acetylgalactosaminyltransferase 2-like n=1 Tax=Trichomycterus rosablanca TaxID=2290929 RepID=UPI002F35D8E4
MTGRNRPELIVFTLHFGKSVRIRAGNALRSSRTAGMFMESMLCFVLYGFFRSFTPAFCTTAHKKAIQRVINTAQKIIGHPLPYLKELYSTRCIDPSVFKSHEMVLSLAFALSFLQRMNMKLVVVIGTPAELVNDDGAPVSSDCQTLLVKHCQDLAEALQNSSACVVPFFSSDVMLQLQESEHGSRIFINVSRPSCTCSAAELARLLPKDSLSIIENHRTEEYRQHQIRMKRSNTIILAQPNSPLQYPMHGVTVIPMRKSEIPGLALHTSRKGPYKVTLKVQLGVLSVDNNVAEAVVEGQNQGTLNISSTRLAIINYLLNKVTYTTSHYHVKATDMVYYTFDDYTALFPIMIQRPKVPVLSDPGNDVNSQVTIVTKTFIRYRELYVLINSIRRYYPTIKIIIADDSFTPEKVNGTNIEQYIMPGGQGWFAGRNLGISQVTTKYFLWVDDDFVFQNFTRIESFVEIMEALPELDVLGGDVGGNQFYFTLAYEEGDENEGGCASRNQNRWHSPVPGFPNCYFVDGVVNFFLARTHSVQQVGFDPFLKRVAHTEFFIDGLGTLLVASCKGLSISHQKRANSSLYSKYRTQKKSAEVAKEKHHYFKNYLKCIRY